MKKTVLGIKIDDMTMDQALDLVQDWLKTQSRHYIVTPNPEIVMAAQKDERYKSILNDADLSIPDGIGLRLSGKVKNHVPGVDLMEQIIKHSIDWGSTIGLLGGGGGVAEKAAERLRKKYPKVRIVYTDSGGIIDKQGEWLEGNRKAFTKIDMLFVGFGPPKQEYWIDKNLKNLNVKVAMGVGGGLDYFSGEVLRAPIFLRSLGLEWLFRLIIQPWRIKRQLALIKFVLLLILK